MTRLLSWNTRLVAILWSTTKYNLLTNAFSFPQLKQPVNKQSINKTYQRSFLENIDLFLTKLQNPKEQLKDHTYLSGNYAPVSKEYVQVSVSVVDGALPPNLNGMFSRNGPNHITTRPNKKLYHWFDGHAMLHNLRIENGKATYTNQFVPSVRYQMEEELEDEYFPTLGEYIGIFGLFKIFFHPDMVKQRVPDLMTVLPPNTNVLMYNKRFYCLNEGNLPFECQLLPDGTLKAVGYETFGGLLNYPVSAHPRIHTNGEDLLFHSYTTNTDLVKRDGTMKVGRYSAKTNSLLSYFVPTPKKDYISFAHGMMNTENFMIIWDCSVHFDARGMFDGESFFRTKSDYNLRFGVIPINATTQDEVIWMDTGKQGAIVHPINSWEDEDGIIVMWTPFCENLVIDLETDDINTFNVVEFRMDPKTGKVSKKVINDSINVEFSVVRKTGIFTRYGYTAIQDKSTPGEGSFAGLCIWDMVKHSYKAIYFSENETGGEPIVAWDKETDLTYVGTYTFNIEENQSYFVLYNGETGELVCRLKMPSRVPYGFHGQWISNDDLLTHFEHHNIQ